MDDAQRVKVEEQQLEVKGLLLAVEERVVVLQEEQGILSVEKPLKVEAATKLVEEVNW